MFKKVILNILLISILASQTFSQGISLNKTGAMADPSAMLDVSATDMGVLIPRIALTDTLDNVTIPSPAHSMIIYNTGTTGGLVEGYYFNKGTAASPYWIELLTNPVSHDINMAGNKIINLATCTNDNDAVNKAYVDALVAGGGGGSSTWQGYPLTWGATQLSNESPTNTYNSLKAIIYCDTLTEGGYTDWYLPSYEEIMYLFISDPSLFSTWQSNHFAWTNSSSWGATQYGVVYCFYVSSPEVASISMNNTWYARCVRK